MDMLEEAGGKAAGSAVAEAVAAGQAVAGKAAWAEKSVVGKAAGKAAVGKAAGKAAATVVVTVGLEGRVVAERVVVEAVTAPGRGIRRCQSRCCTGGVRTSCRWSNLAGQHRSQLDKACTRRHRSQEYL